MVALPELDVARIRTYCGGRVPERFGAEARVEATRRGKSVTIFDCRPPWHRGLTEWSRVPVAQLRYDLIEPGTVTELLAEIEQDPTGIFWG